MSEKPPKSFKEAADDLGRDAVPRADVGDGIRGAGDDLVDAHAVLPFRCWMIEGVMACGCSALR